MNKIGVKRMEIWSIYDVHRQKTDKTKLRGEKFESDEFHQVIHVCLFNSNNECLIQKRHPQKQGWSGLWDISCGGSALVNETSQQAAQRELNEELGVDVDFSLLRPQFTINFSFGFDDFYVIRHDVKVSDLVFQDEEVVDARWASMNEIISLIDSQQFIPYKKEVIQLIFSMVDSQGGVHQDV